MMRVILVGGSGLIGRALASELVLAGYSPVILSRNPGRIAPLPENVDVAGWDGKTSQGWMHLVEGAKAVVNLAGENIAGESFFPKRWSEARKQLILESRLNAGQAVVEAIRNSKKRPDVLIQTSAIGYYGPLGNDAVDEESPPGNDFLARTCVAWENSTRVLDELGVRRIIVRTGVVLSPKGGAFTRLLLPFKFFAGGPLGSGKQVLSWIHIADQIGAICYLIGNMTASGIFNLTAPHPLTNAEFAKTIGRILGRPAFLPVPAFVFRMLFGEVATVVVDGQRVLPSRLQQIGYTFQYEHADEAVRNLLGR